MATGHLGFVAVPIGAAGNGIEVVIANSSGTPNVVYAISVSGTTINITPATDGGGTITTQCSDVVASIASTPAAAALVVASVVVAGSTPFGTAIISGGSGGAVGLSRGIGIKIKDWNGKYYMNDYVPLDLIFGFDNSQTPGLLYPEIYIPRQQNIFFELIALPSGASPSGIVTLTEKGAKVYA